MARRRGLSKGDELIEEHSGRIQNAKPDMSLAGVCKLREFVGVDGRDDRSASLGEVFTTGSAVGLVVNDPTDSRLRVRHEFP